MDKHNDDRSPQHHLSDHDLAFAMTLAELLGKSFTALQIEWKYSWCFERVKDYRRSPET